MRAGLTTQKTERRKGLVTNKRGSKPKATKEDNEWA